MEILHRIGDMLLVITLQEDNQEPNHLKALQLIGVYRMLRHVEGKQQQAINVAIHAAIYASSCSYGKDIEGFFCDIMGNNLNPTETNIGEMLRDIFGVDGEEIDGELES